MTKKSKISNEMLADTIDGVATREISQLVYKAIEEDEDLRQAFNYCMFMKIFEEEIENDFREHNAYVTLELEHVVEMPDDTDVFDPAFLHIKTQDVANNHTILNLNQLSGNYTSQEESPETGQEGSIATQDATDNHTILNLNQLSGNYTSQEESVEMQDTTDNPSTLDLSQLSGNYTGSEARDGKDVEMQDNNLSPFNLNQLSGTYTSREDGDEETNKEITNTVIK
jgi:hypothetical protein